MAALRPGPCPHVQLATWLSARSGRRCVCPRSSHVVSALRFRRNGTAVVRRIVARTRAARIRNGSTRTIPQRASYVTYGGERSHIFPRLRTVRFSPAFRALIWRRRKWGNVRSTDRTSPPRARGIRPTIFSAGFTRGIILIIRRGTVDVNGFVQRWQVARIRLSRVITNWLQRGNGVGRRRRCQADIIEIERDVFRVLLRTPLIYAT